MCSSRPDPIFLKIFADSGTTVDMSSLNRGDIARFALARFRKELSDDEYITGYVNCKNLVPKIMQKAEGVFCLSRICRRRLDRRRIAGRRYGHFSSQEAHRAAEGLEWNV
jgi:hypothetical protein